MIKDDTFNENYLTTLGVDFVKNNSFIPFFKKINRNLKQ